jgi:hypothetical protein
VGLYSVHMHAHMYTDLISGCWYIYSGYGFSFLVES